MDEHPHTSFPGRNALRVAAALALAVAALAGLARPASATGGPGRPPADHGDVATPPSTATVSHSVSAPGDGAGASAPATAPTTSTTSGRDAAWWVLGIAIAMAGGSTLVRVFDRRRRRASAVRCHIRL